MNHKNIKILLGAAALGITFGALIPTDAQGKWVGTISMWAQSYTPNSTRPNANKLSEFRKLADEYEKSKPGIKISFIDEDFPEYNQTVRAKAAGGDLWDVFWAQSGDLNSTYPEGIAVDLRSYFAQKNPYVPAAATWADAMNKTVIASISAPDGAVYQVNGDFVATTFYYNKTLFAKAKINSAPKTWTELISAARKLKAVGITAGVGVPIYSWYQRHFLTDFYANDYERLAGFDKKPGMSALDQAAAIKTGLISTKDRRFMGWWSMFKQFTDNWIPDYLAVGPFSTENDYQDFVAGKAAMFYMGSWIAPNLRKTKLNFGTFGFPVVGKSSPYSTGMDTSSQVGGPGAAFQYAISTLRSNKTMNQTGKFEAVLDWLRFISTPKASERVINEFGGFIPSFPGTTSAPGTEDLVAATRIKNQAVVLDQAGPKLDADMQRIFGAYLTNNTSLSEATKQVQAALDAALVAFEKENGVINITK